jgi:hypothetical protein
MDNKNYIQISLLIIEFKYKLIFIFHYSIFINNYIKFKN